MAIPPIDACFNHARLNERCPRHLSPQASALAGGGTFPFSRQSEIGFMDLNQRIIARVEWEEEHRRVRSWRSCRPA
jgi:hypothetical protein